jgi:hypothetical protein
MHFANPRDWSVAVIEGNDMEVILSHEVPKFGHGCQPEMRTTLLGCDWGLFVSRMEKKRAVRKWTALFIGVVL